MKTQQTVSNILDYRFVSIDPLFIHVRFECGYDQTHFEKRSLDRQLNKYDNSFEVKY